jgi:3-oxoacyl-[acyl-carrier protein] reductase
MKIIITGASRGIGYEAVLALSDNPQNKILALSRDEKLLKTLAKSAIARNGNDNVDYLQFDLTNPDEEALRHKLEAIGGVDVLVNNAGLLVNKPFEKLSDQDWQESFAVNFFGVVRLIRFLLPRLKASDRAHIVNIASMGGFLGSVKFPGLSAYSASKAAIANLTECLAEEFKEYKITVNALAIGAVQTEMLEQAFPGYHAPVTSEQMGNFLAWFSIQGMQFFNGKILPVSVSTP